MRDDEVRARLGEVNPWWSLAAGGRDPRAWAGTDRVLRDRARYDLGYRPPVLMDIAKEPLTDRLVVLRGPRRVGKSVALKDLALELCGREDIDPRQLVYVPVDGMRPRDLGRVGVLGRDITRSVDREGNRPRIWLLDEITGIAGWSEQLKYMRDNTAFGDDTVVCTGSSWGDEAEVDRNLGAGRSGSYELRRMRVLLPMTFRNFLAATRPEHLRPGPVEPWCLQGDTARELVHDAAVDIDGLDLAWQAYLTAGGFPRAVAEHERQGTVSDAFMQDLAAWLHRDVDPESAAESIPLLLATLAERTTAPLSRTNVAQTLGYATRPTFDRRIDRLVHAFGALWCHQVDKKGTRVAGAQSKLYLADPLLAWIGPGLRAGAPPPDFTRLTEAALGVALAQAIDAIQPGRWITQDALGYLRTGKGNEIDFGPSPVPTPAGTRHTTPIEGKWVADGWRREALVLEGRLGHGILATKTVLDTSHPTWAVPAPMVALLLG